MFSRVDCALSYSHQQWLRVPVAPHPHQHLVLSVFLFLAIDRVFDYCFHLQILNGMWWSMFFCAHLPLLCLLWWSAPASPSFWNTSDRGVRSFVTVLWVPETVHFFLQSILSLFLRLVHFCHPILKFNSFLCPLHFVIGSTHRSLKFWLLKSSL